MFTEPIRKEIAKIPLLDAYSIKKDENGYFVGFSQKVSCMPNETRVNKPKLFVGQGHEILQLIKKYSI